MRLDTDALVNQFEATLALTDRLDREGPDAAGSINFQPNIDSQPAIGKTEPRRLVEIELLAEVAKTIALAIG